MNRRLFLQFPLVAGALVSQAHAIENKRSKKGFKVAAGADHFDEELLFMGGRFYCKVSAKDTDGDLCIYDTVRWEKGGPAMHLHHHQDEWFYVVRGEFIIKIGDDTFELRPGDAAFAPRTVPHAFANISEGEAQMLVLFQPAGSMEEFFTEASKISKSVHTGEWSEASKMLSRKHGMEVVGPPLKI